MIVLNFPSLLAAPNVKAFIRVCRSGETWNDDANPGSEYDERAFRVRYGGWDPVARRHLPPKFFDSFDEHPRILELTPTGERSSAAGALQITMSTWDDMRARYAGFGPKFTPWDQMACGVALIHAEGALDDVLAGRLEEAIAKCGNRWASLPRSTLDDGGSKMTMARARDVWTRWGGYVPTTTSVAPPEDRTHPPAPIEERGVPARQEDIDRIAAEGSAHHIAAEAPQEEGMAPLIIGLLGSLAQVFSPLVQSKLTKALDKQTGDTTVSNQMAQQLMQIVQQLAAQAIPGGGAAPPVMAPTSDPVLAIATVKADPTLVRKAEEQISSFLDQMLPVLDRVERMEQLAWAAEDDGRDRAAVRAKGEDDLARPLVMISAALVALLVVFACGIAVWQVVKDGAPTTEVWAQIAGLIGFGTGVWVTIVSYRFGSSRQSQTKDFAIAELSTRRKA